MGELDKELKLFYLRDIEISNKYKNAIDTALYTKKEKSFSNRFGIMKTAVATVSCIIIMTGVVFAKDISNYIKYFFNTSKGLDTAIEKGYIEEPDMEYIKSNNTEIKVENMLMDDFNLNFTFSVKPNEENINISEIVRMRFPDMIITDEENRILYCENREVFVEYCKLKDLDYEYAETNENYINNGSNWYIKAKNTEDGKIELVYNLYSNGYPKSKKIYINLNQINMTRYEISEEEEIALTGDWKMEIDVPEKFYNREAFIYIVEYCSDPSLNITEAIVYDTCMKFEFTAQVKPIYNENDSKEVQEEDLNNFNAFVKNDIIMKLKGFINDDYVENEKGKRFYPTMGNANEAGTMYEIDGSFRHWQTFSLTKHEMTDELTILFNILFPYETKDVVIKLKRNV